MFYRCYSLLAPLARPGCLNLPRGREASPKLPVLPANPFEGMPLSRRLAAPEEYRAVQAARRQALEALIRQPLEEDGLAQAVDLIAALCEESRWSENPSGERFEDDAHPAIDFQSAETAALLAWTVRALGERLGARVTGKALYEVRRRVFSPFLAHEDYPFMRARGPRPLTVLTDILLSAMLLEQSDQRRAALLKQALRLIDQAVNARADRAEALSDAAVETAAVTDLTLCLYRATRGSVDLRATYPTPAWLDQLLYPWLEGECFCDPAGTDMVPALSGAELYRIGRAADDDALMALGGRLDRLRSRPSSTVTGRLLDLELMGDLAAESRKLPRIRSAATQRSRVMVSRFNGMTCAMHTGSGAAGTLGGGGAAANGNAGGILLFCDGEPVLIEAGPMANLPTIGGANELARPDLECEAEFKPAQPRDILSVDLTHAWPPGRVRAYQRTAMTERGESLLRLVDAIELDESAAVVFRFYTAQKPERLTGGWRLGGVDLTWEGELTATVKPEGREYPRSGGSPVYQIELATPAPVRRAIYTFIFARNTEA